MGDKPDGDRKRSGNAFSTVDKPSVGQARILNAVNLLRFGSEREGRCKGTSVRKKDDTNGWNYNRIEKGQSTNRT